MTIKSLLPNLTRLIALILILLSFGCSAILSDDFEYYYGYNRDFSEWKNAKSKFVWGSADAYLKCKYRAVNRDTVCGIPYTLGFHAYLDSEVNEGKIRITEIKVSDFAGTTILHSKEELEADIRNEYGCFNQNNALIEKIYKSHEPCLSRFATKKWSSANAQIHINKLDAENLNLQYLDYKILIKFEVELDGTKHEESVSYKFIRSFHRWYRYAFPT